jgi:hypothetical protein
LQDKEARVAKKLFGDSSPTRSPQPRRDVLAAERGPLGGPLGGLLGGAGAASVTPASWAEDSPRLPQQPRHADHEGSWDVKSALGEVDSRAPAASLARHAAEQGHAAGLDFGSHDAVKRLCGILENAGFDVAAPSAAATTSGAVPVLEAVAKAVSELVQAYERRGELLESALQGTVREETGKEERDKRSAQGERQVAHAEARAARAEKALVAIRADMADARRAAGEELARAQRQVQAGESRAMASEHKVRTSAAEIERMSLALATEREQVLDSRVKAKETLTRLRGGKSPSASEGHLVDALVEKVRGGGLPETDRACGRRTVWTALPRPGRWTTGCRTT